MAALSGYALVLTDIVGSTTLAASLGDAAMSSLWETHDRITRDLFVAWRGQEIDRTDGFLAIFESPVDAVQFTFAYHRALAALPIPLNARVGVHVGTVRLREN